MLDKVLGLVAPHSCVSCSGIGSLLCSNCSAGLKPAISRCYRCHQISEDFRTCSACRRTSKLYSVIARTRYEGAAEALVQKLKFDNARAGASDIARGLVTLLPDEPKFIITHLPTATSRVRTRGYDQARLIARQLASKTNLPYDNLLERIGQARQVGASRTERLANASKMFRAKNVKKLSGVSVVLVDDVITTGASLEAAAAILRASGAKRIYGLVFCQA